MHRSIKLSNALVQINKNTKFSKFSLTIAKHFYELNEKVCNFLEPDEMSKCLNFQRNCILFSSSLRYHSLSEKYEYRDFWNDAISKTNE